MSLCLFGFNSNVFNDFLNALLTGFQNFRVLDALDIIFITLILFWLVNFFRKLGATHLLRGLLFVFIGAYIVSNIFELTMINWLLDKLLISGVLFIAIMFQPELRRALDHLGRNRHSTVYDNSGNDELIKALKNLAKRSVGALILIENSESLQDICDTGVKLDSLISSELIENIFEDKTPLHDGAVVIRNGRIEAAACIIPLINRLPNVPQQFGTRHRAAVSATIKNDCLAIIVSEETGRISYAYEGTLYTGIDSVQLNKIIHERMDNDDVGKPKFNLFRLLFNNKVRTEDDKENENE